MFKPGETVIYGGEGVCTVEKIDSMDVRGVSKDKQIRRKKTQMT